MDAREFVCVCESLYRFLNLLTNCGDFCGMQQKQNKHSGASGHGVLTISIFTHTHSLTRSHLQLQSNI